MVEIPELSKEDIQRGVLPRLHRRIPQESGSEHREGPGRNVYGRWAQDDDNKVIRKLLFT